LNDPVSSFVKFVLDRLSCFVEEVTVHALQRQMPAGISVTKIPVALEHYFWFLFRTCGKYTPSFAKSKSLRLPYYVQFGMSLPSVVDHGFTRPAWSGADERTSGRRSRNSSSRAAFFVSLRGRHGQRPKLLVAVLIHDQRLASPR